MKKLYHKICGWFFNKKLKLESKIVQHTIKKFGKKMLKYNKKFYYLGNIIYYEGDYEGVEFKRKLLREKPMKNLKEIK